MDALALGALFRLVRIHRRLRQEDVARRAGVSASIVSRIEHGQLGSIRPRLVERVAAVLEIRLDYRARWHAGDFDRLADRDHAQLVELLADRLRSAGWEARPEVSFAIWGDRGSIDLLGWQAATGSLLVTEVKTEIADVGETLRRLDVKARRAQAIATSVGWPEPSMVSVALVVAEGRTNRRRLAAHTETFRAALPDSGRQLRALLAGHRRAPIRAIALLPFPRIGTARPRSAGVHRVRVAKRASRRAA